MKNALLAILLCAIPSAAAQRSKISGAAHTVGRTARNMVTFRDKTAGVEEWLTLAAAIGDAAVSEHALKTLTGAREANPIFGSHPGIGTYLALEIPVGMYSATVTQYAHEQYDRTGKSYRSMLPLAVNGGIHTFGMFWAEHELRQCHQAGIQCQ